MINFKLEQYKGICISAGKCGRCKSNPTNFEYSSSEPQEGISGYCMYARLSEGQIKEILDEQWQIDREMERRWHFTFRM